MIDRVELRATAQAAPLGATVTCPICAERQYVKRSSIHMQCAVCRDAKQRRYLEYRQKRTATEGTVYEPRKNGMQSLNRRNRFAQK